MLAVFWNRVWRAITFLRRSWLVAALTVPRSGKRYNEERPHSGKYCFDKTPMQTLLDSIPLAKQEMLDHTLHAVA
jgi:hypothetical protein